VFLRFFRSSFASQYTVIAIAGLILWSRAFFSPPQMPVPEGPVPFYSLVYLLFSGHSHLAAVLGYLMIMGSALYFNRVITRHEIVTKNSSLAAFLFVVLSSYLPFLLTINPVNLSVFFLLLVITQLFETYNREEPLELVYAAGFFVSIGSFFYFPFILFYLFVLLSFIIFRSITWRYWIGSFIGLATPYLFLAVYYFWVDQLSVKFFEYGHYFTIPFNTLASFSPVFLIYTAILFFGVITGFFSSASHLSEKTIEIRKKNILLYWFIVLIIVSFLFAGNLQVYHTLFLVIVITPFASSFLLVRKKTFVAELICILFFIAIALNNLIFGYQ
jgi:hypothetical protein